LWWWATASPKAAAIRFELPAEVAYADITREGSVRHSVFHGLRNDKPAMDITEEKAKPAAESGKIWITHPERVTAATSGSTKMQAEYYARRCQGRRIVSVEFLSG
jgi:hypothetical protein